MAKRARKTEVSISPELERLVREGRLRAPEHRLADVLAKRGPLKGPVTDAGSRAVQEQRGDRD